MKELMIPAKVEELNTVLAFLDELLEEHGCSMKAQIQLDIAVEEIFVNIAHYAYAPAEGNACIQVEFSENPLSVEIKFKDQGKPFDPLKKPDPDVTLSAEEREIGGLGIYMVKKSMNEVTYKYENGSNILTIKKEIG